MTSHDALDRLTSRLEIAVNRLEALSTRPAVAPKPGHLLQNSRSSSPAPVSVEPPPHVVEYDESVGPAVANFLELCDGVGGDVKEISAQLSDLFIFFRKFLWSAAGRPAPVTSDALSAELAPLGEKITALGAFRELHRRSPLFNHLSAITEGIPALSWVAVKPAPAPFVGEMKDAAEFYTNRVLQHNKEHADWARAWIALLAQMQTFVRRTHTTGLVWNSKPGAKPVENGVHHLNGHATPSTGGPPPPPPPPPPGPPPPGLFAPAPPSGRDALFAELNQGDDVTRRLKKVTPDMQTHKNPNLRGGNVVTAREASNSSTTSNASSPSNSNSAKPPRIQLENDQRWAVEYFNGKKDIKVEVTDKKHTLYAFKCNDCVIQVVGKLNSITLDSCKKTAIVFDSLLAQCETVNCQSVTIQTLGEMPTLSIQKTDGCQVCAFGLRVGLKVYLSAQSLNTELVTSKSSEMNVLVPKEDGDFEEFPIPEQFKTTFDKSARKLVTTVSDII